MNKSAITGIISSSKILSNLALVVALTCNPKSGLFGYIKVSHSPAGYDTWKNVGPTILLLVGRFQSTKSMTSHDARQASLLL